MVDVEYETDEEIDEIYNELARLETEYDNIILTINSEFRKSMRKLGIKKNVIPIKYILTEEMIKKLREYSAFNRVWKAKKEIVKFSNGLEEFDKEVELFPNIGGVPVETGKVCSVEVIQVPKRVRQKKKEKKRKGF